MKLLRKPRNVGVVLPTGSAAAITTMAVLLRGRVLVPLNVNQSRDNVQAAIEASAIEQVYTSHAFAEFLAQRGIVLSELLQGVAIHYVEDIRERTAAWRLLLAKFQFAVVPVRWFYRLRGRRVGIESPAAILFSGSGNSGIRQRGVVLSHRNIMANCKQLSDVLNTRMDDVMLCSLPPCYSLGLMVHTMMPLVEGIPMACHPDRSDSQGVAKTIARNKATILLGTPREFGVFASDTKIHPLMLESIRLVVSGVKPLSEEVRVNFELKFGKMIYDGYGTPEAAVASVNIPDAMSTSDWIVQQGNMPGTVGMPLPGTSFKIVDPVGMQLLPLGADGLVLISGDQVMSAYLNDEEGAARVISEIDGLRWFHSGDEGHLTEEGFLVITEHCV
jgi:acyl-[acyl-carrier-protein]-phospholipid O-acyltransferase/long-chain-fatty-acid--[acyl-carrier-protein] ligase